MEKLKHLLLSFQFLFLACAAFSQQPNFNLVLDEKKYNFSGVFSLTQDPQGYIWFTSVTKGLQRYDGKKVISYSHDNDNPNSIINNLTLAVSADSSGYIWVGTGGFGVDRFDPATNKFTHFKHDPKNPASLGNDSIFYLMTDHTGNIWLGSFRGVDMYDHKTGKFTHYAIDEKLTNLNPGDNLGVNTIYEDKKGTIWIGWGDAFAGKKESPGGLVRLDRFTGKLTKYKHDPADPNSLADNNVFAIYEDSKDNLWIGTRGDGLHTLDRATGRFTHYYYDSTHTEKPGPPPYNETSGNTFISFITEDVKGRLWIGSMTAGINVYDPVTKEMVHYGNVANDKTNRFAKDTLTGFTSNGAVRALPSKDGLLWIAGFPASIYNINFSKTTVPFVSLNAAAGSFYFEEDKNTLWIQSDSGIIRKNLNTNREKLFKHDPKNENSLIDKNVMNMDGDGEGNIWMATHWNGVEKFNIATEKFTHYHHDKDKPNSLVHDSTHALFFDRENFLWIGTHKGLSRMDIKTGLCANYIHDDKDSLSLANSSLYSIAQEKDGTIWAAGASDINRLDTKTGKFRHYPIGSITYNVYIDAADKIWAGGEAGLYYLNEKKDIFIKYTNPVFPGGLGLVAGIVEDDKKNLWLSTNDALIKISEARDAAKVYNSSNGVQPISNVWLENIKTKDGRLFLGSLKGYYSFRPDELVDNRTAPMLQFTNFKIGNKEIVAGDNNVLSIPIWQTKDLVLGYDQNTFSFDFNAIDYKNAGEIKYLYKLENYDNDWRDIGTEHKATFYNVPQGKYILHIKAVNNEGSVAEKSIAITITPPWWKTWWAYSLYALLIIAAGFGIYKYQRQYIIKKEREKTQLRELAQAKEIEKAYRELKATQAQLIQSEKMASLGELTAGIAHEIQNPLNFVNNFSEVNTELIDEAGQEIDKGNIKEVRIILNDIKENEQKINHHGKRADAIVKGMLQHSQSSSSIKELTDINKLADEYLRLSYHGLRAKDKDFNATIKTDFDESIGSINIIPQDIGRVLLNLYNNAFYAVNERQKQSPQPLKRGEEEYEPLVTVSTRRLGSPPTGGDEGKIEIRVADNGNGIPQKVLDKIFQPFFTTKPTGQGTGLGLSLSYDIIKAHGGELKVETKEGQGTVFIVQLPLNKA
ncbi:MAG: two-component regulator propeller domain-containing protein [Chitinophagaceae bacterium]